MWEIGKWIEEMVQNPFSSSWAKRLAIAVTLTLISTWALLLFGDYNKSPFTDWHY